MNFLRRLIESGSPRAERALVYRTERAEIILDELKAALLPVKPTWEILNLHGEPHLE